jgi:hypothetical protein
MRLVVACVTLCLAGAAYTAAPGLLPAGNDLPELSQAMDPKAAELACDASEKCMGFTFDEDGETPPYIFFKSAGSIALPESKWKTHLKIDFKPKKANVQQMEVGADGSAGGDAVAAYDPRCGPDVTTAGGRSFSCEANAKSGECQINPGWMIMFCPNACGMCDLKVGMFACTPMVLLTQIYIHQVDRAHRCDRQRLNISTSPIFAPGDMDAMFEKLAFGEAYKKYTPEVVHRGTPSVLLPCTHPSSVTTTNDPPSCLFSPHAGPLNFRPVDREVQQLCVRRRNCCTSEEDCWPL